MSESKGAVTILQLYPRDMNIYGDWGNVLTLSRRLEWHGYTPVVVGYDPGEAFPEDVDLVVGGGGQDSGQGVIQTDLRAIGPRLREWAEDDVPMLAICGLYQLFGRFFRTLEGEMIEGIGLLDIETIGGQERLIGNIVTESSEFGQVIGYENHSGKTYLGAGATPFGRVLAGAGNNGEDGTEGVRHRNVVGSYLHGSLLPKNPLVADFLIERAVVRRHGSFTPGDLDDTVEHRARTVAAARPR
ncbi:MAG: glutamine amidotransferase [Aeromicrobium sp.]|uniref:type 1 glutamine amidotransferase n=1 Tax=Aeromicrobium sp. TaxID=1871063 RepID=UPI0039E7106B